MSTDYYTKDQQGNWVPTKTVVASGNASPKPSRRRNGLLIGVIVTLLVAVGGGFAVYRYVQGPKDAAMAATQSYCAQLKSQDYVGAYAQLAPRLHDQNTQAAYIASAKAIDSQNGTVTACAATNATTSGDAINTTIAVTRQHLPQTNATLPLANISGEWKQTQLPDPAIATFTTAYAFCNELQSPNFGQSFALLSSHFQQSTGGAATYISDASGSIGITGAIKGCRLQQAFIAKGNTGATIKFGIDFDHFVNLPAQVGLLMDTTGHWKVDSMQFTAAGQSLPFPLPLSTVQNILNLLKQICSLAPPNAICSFIEILP